MQKKNSLFSKKWFIKSSEVKIENVYKFDVEKVFKK